MSSGRETAHGTPHLRDLRAPLDSVLAYVDLLLEDEMNEEERRRFLEVIRVTAARARRIVAEHERSAGLNDRRV